MTPRIYTDPRLLRAAFRLLDADADGFISPADIGACLRDSPRRALIAAEVVKSAGAPGGGRMDYAAFEAVVRGQKGV